MCEYSTSLPSSWIYEFWGGNFGVWGWVVWAMDTDVQVKQACEQRWYFI